MWVGGICSVHIFQSYFIENKSQHSGLCTCNTKKQLTPDHEWFLFQRNKRHCTGHGLVFQLMSFKRQTCDTKFCIYLCKQLWYAFTNNSNGHTKWDVNNAPPGAQMYCISEKLWERACNCWIIAFCMYLP
jgi:hypothetical protein